MDEGADTDLMFQFCLPNAKVASGKTLPLFLSRHLSCIVCQKLCPYCSVGKLCCHDASGLDSDFGLGHTNFNVLILVGRPFGSNILVPSI